ncbi:MAG: hypothetical protein EA378_06260 [Phycisphaerales bacterium]|nr:MAG: hypothetical protein EA378_06260 [Phycisphaerales bacterium]
MPARTPLALCTLALLAGAPLAAHAQLLRASSETVAFIFDPDGNIENSNDQFFEADDLPYFVVGSRHGGSVTRGGGQTSGSAAIGMGYIRTNSRTSGFILNFGSLSSWTSASFEDSILFEDPTIPNGTPGAATLAITFTHAQGFGGPGLLDGTSATLQTSASMVVRINGNIVVQESIQGGFVGFDTFINGEIPEQILVPVNFVYGTPFTLRVQASTDSRMDSDGGGVQGYAFNTFPTSVRTQGFQDLPPTTTVTGTIDWTQPAPVVPDLECRADLTGAALDGEPDGVVSTADLNYYITLWLADDPAADLAGPDGQGVPDGLVTITDLNFYVNRWLGALGECL